MDPVEQQPDKDPSRRNGAHHAAFMRPVERAPKPDPADWKHAIPDDMKALKQWVAWRGDKKPKMLPDGLRSAEVDNPATWGGWGEACHFYSRNWTDPRGAGIGFVFTKAAGLIFIDFDSCLDETGKLREWAEPLVRPFVGKTYIEVSPSGRGLHVFLRGTLPETTRSGASVKMNNRPGAVAKSKVEVYYERRHSTVTGIAFEKSGGPPMPCQEQLNELLRDTELDKRFAPPESGKDGEAEEITPETLKEIKAAFAATSPDIGYEPWLKMGMAVRGLGPVGFKFWDDWSRGGRKYVPGETSAKWASFESGGGGGSVNLASLFYVAQREGNYKSGATAAEDFKDFKNVDPADEEEKPDRYEVGSVKKYKALGLRLVSKGTVKNPKPPEPAVSETNIDLYLEGHERWKGQLRFNVRTQQIDSLDGKQINVRELTRHVDFFMDWDRGPGAGMVYRVARDIAECNAYDPVVEWLESLQWDGTPRLEGLCALVGLEDTKLTRRHMRRWMIGAVARAFEPGCPMQNMLMLHGAQGKKKSAFFGRLAVKAAWYSESHVDMTSKDGLMQLLGPWIVENAELSGMSKADVDRVKAFITDAGSKFREPYGREVREHPRRSVLCGTTNETEFLRDSSGARRFWLIGVPEDTELHLELLTPEWVEQLWAEAVAVYQAKERWWDADEEVDEVMAANEKHYVVTALDGLVQQVLVELETRKVTTVHDVKMRLIDRLRINQNTRDIDIAAAMKRVGWVKVQLRVGGGERTRFWHTPKVQKESAREAAVLAFSRGAGEFEAVPE